MQCAQFLQFANRFGQMSKRRLAGAPSTAHLWDEMAERTHTHTQVITFEYNRENANEHLMMNDELRTESFCV